MRALAALAARAKELAIVRSMSHPEGNHLPAVHRVLTGRYRTRGERRSGSGCVARRFSVLWRSFRPDRRRRDGVPSGVALPTRLVEGPLTWPGQDAGFLGPRHDPWQLRLDPGHPEVTGRQPGIAGWRRSEACASRRHLLSQTAHSSGRALPRPAGRRHCAFVQREGRAGSTSMRKTLGWSTDMGLISSAGRSSGATTDRIGSAGRSGHDGHRSDLGYARREFSSATGDLLPPLDQAVSALLDDLIVRGLLDETLVVMLGEFGRTPKIARLTPDACARPRSLAGGLSRRCLPVQASGGQLIGKSDRLGRIRSRAVLVRRTWRRRSIMRWAWTRQPSCATDSAARCGFAQARRSSRFTRRRRFESSAIVEAGLAQLDVEPANRLSFASANVCMSWRVLP